MKHEVDLVATEVVPTQIITDVVFTPAPSLQREIDEHFAAREQFEAAQKQFEEKQEVERRRQRELAARRAQNSYCDCSPTRYAMMRY